jgi:glycosyltransferase involved in cell wall biosynthesis
MHRPTFSVVIPVFNSERTIADTVHSVLRQTDRDFEVLLIDDGSRDDSLVRMRVLATEDPRVQVVSCDNAGVAATRNLGATMARGDLIAFLDADDLWHPSKLAQHRALHDADPALGVSFARVAFVSPGREAFDPDQTCSTVPLGRLTLDQLIAENPVCTASNIVVTRACFEASGGFRVDMRYAEDQEWLARLAASGITIRGTSKRLVEYRTTPGGLSSDLRRMHSGWRTFAYHYRHQINIDSVEAVYCRYLARRALRSGAPSRDAMLFAFLGLFIDARAFFSDRHRGALTLGSAIASPLIPTALRRYVFA